MNSNIWKLEEDIDFLYTQWLADKAHREAIEYIIHWCYEDHYIDESEMPVLFEYNDNKYEHEFDHWEEMLYDGN